MAGIKTTTKKITATIVEIGNGGFVAYCNEPGGPVVSANTKEAVERKFENALNLAFAIDNLNFFNELVRGSSAEKADKSKKLITLPKFDIEYIPPTRPE